jgi:hypothetical protein
MRHHNAALGFLALAAFVFVLARAPRTVRIAYLAALAITTAAVDSRQKQA